jgi:hypothetical protein
MHAPLFRLSGMHASMRQFIEEHAREESGPLQVVRPNQRRSFRAADTNGGGVPPNRG